MKKSEMNNCPQCGSDKTQEYWTVSHSSARLGELEVRGHRILCGCDNCHTQYDKCISYNGDEPTSIQFEYDISHWVEDVREVRLAGETIKDGRMLTKRIITEEYPIED